VSDVGDLRPEAIWCEAGLDRMVCGARKSHLTAQLKNRHYSRAQQSVKVDFLVNFQKAAFIGPVIVTKK
jgi:hypothetical protein